MNEKRKEQYDPDVAWNQLAQAFVDGDERRAVMIAAKLGEYIRHGGRGPKLSKHPEFNECAAWSMCLYLVDGFGEKHGRKSNQ